jgi:hypothetical protein
VPGSYSIGTGAHPVGIKFELHGHSYRITKTTKQYTNEAQNVNVIGNLRFSR